MFWAAAPPEALHLLQFLFSDTEAETFAGDYPPAPPSLTCDAAGAGGRREKRAPYHLPLRQSVGSPAGHQGGVHKDLGKSAPNLYKASPLTPFRLRDVSNDTETQAGRPGNLAGRRANKGKFNLDNLYNILK